MKVYYVYVDKCDYDEYDGLVVVAENEDRVLEMVKGGYFGKSYFAEWSLLWLDAIISLRMSEIKMGGVNNGR